MKRTITLIALLALAGCKEAAEKVAEKGIEGAKETAKGLEEGIDKGRKQGESLDGAVIVSSAAELTGKGIVTIFAVAPAGTLGSIVTLSVENLGDKPLRLTKLSFLVLDKDNFATPVTGAATEVTVPAKAKGKVELGTTVPFGKVAKVRYWDVDLVAPPQAASPFATSALGSAKAASSTAAPKASAPPPLPFAKPKETLKPGF